MNKVELRPAAAQCHAHFLRRVVEQAHRDSNTALVDLADARALAQSEAAPADFQYVDRRDGLAHTIATARFHRQYALCLQDLELSICGYCIRRQFGWERQREAALSTRRPALWRRLLRPAPLMSLWVRVGPEGSSMGIAPARAHQRAGGAPLIVRLDQTMQEDLALAHDAAQVTGSLKTRLLAFLRRWRKAR